MPRPTGSQKLCVVSTLRLVAVGALLVGEALLAAVGFRVGQVELGVRDVEVADQHAPLGRAARRAPRRGFGNEVELVGEFRVRLAVGHVAAGRGYAGAARLSGYAWASARQTGSRLMKQPEVAARVVELTEADKTRRHAELVAAGGIYAQLWAHQTGGFIGLE